MRVVPLVIPSPLLRRVQRRRAQRRWQSVWRRPQDRVGSLPSDGVAGEIRAAFDDGWLAPGMRILEIGCGSGENAAWLARQGCLVTGIDCADAAVAKATAAHEEKNLSFAAGDITARGVLSGQEFDGFVDRGCLHGIDAAVYGAYAENVRRLAAPGARIVLAMRLTDREPIDSRERVVRRVLLPHFRVLDRTTTVLGTRSPHQPIAGIVYRLIRDDEPRTAGPEQVGGLWPVA